MTVPLLLAACGVPGGAADEPTVVVSPATPSSTAMTTPPVRSTGDLDVIVAPDGNGEYPEDLMVTCHQGVFPIGALDEISPLDVADPGGVAEAIAPFLTSEEGRYWPQDGWQILYQTAEQVQLVARGADGHLAFMSVSNDGTGWTWSGASGSGEECRLEFAIPEGLNTVDWRLDPEGESPGPDSTSIDVLIQERECVGGREIGDRLVGPQIVMTTSSVFIAFAAQPPPGDAFDCQGNPSTSYRIALPEMMGARSLVDGLEIGITLDDFVD